MRFEKETENKIREAFRQEDFQNFMFEQFLMNQKTNMMSYTGMYINGNLKR